ncbi:MAG: BCD family MFS transporter [Rubrivivax sp.]|nr:BCD family MFS transporter [Rubrivivax sp.]
MTWLAIFRLGLIQAALGAIVVLTTSTLNRVMVVELALPALVPGLLVALHYAVQLSRPRMGFGSDQGQRRSPWIAVGMAVLALGGFGAAVGTAWAATAPVAGLVLTALSFVLVGLGVAASGTSLLALLATRVAQERRAAAATLVWVMMIMGFAVTAGLAGHFLDPFTPARLVLVSGCVSVLALSLALVALAGVENSASVLPRPAEYETRPRFLQALQQVWLEPDARRFTVFVFVSMIAYSAQDLILEPFAGVRFGFTPGESTQLSGVQHGGTLMGMLLAALAGRRLGGVFFGSLRSWMVGGCFASALALAGLVAGGIAGPGWPLRANVFLLGVANGAFSIAAIGSMMALAGQGRAAREGTRMGLWGAAQAIGFAVGGLLGTAASDLARLLIGSQVAAYLAVFGAEALLFVVAAALAAHVCMPVAARAAPFPQRIPSSPREDVDERIAHL